MNGSPRLIGGKPLWGGLVFERFHDIIVFISYSPILVARAAAAGKAFGLYRRVCAVEL
jgi:hypothetical protein